MLGCDSDNDQGFVPTRVEIKSENKIKDRPPRSDPKYDRPVDMNTRYLYGDGIYRKQPAPIYSRFATFRQGTRNGEPGPPGKQQFRQAPAGGKRGRGQCQSNQEPQQSDQEQPQDSEAQNNATSMAQQQSAYISSSHQPRKSSVVLNEPTMSLTDGMEREGPGHPYHKYFHNPAYTLVYSKYRDRQQHLTPESDDIFDNQINLSRVLGKYDADNYTVFKAYEPGRGSQRVHSQSNQHYGPVHSHGHSNLHPHNSSSQHNPQGQPPAGELEFDSRFESGNLLYAFRSRKSPHSYTLFTQNDTNTYGYNQWFYFSVRNARAHTKYRFAIVNLRKRHSMFREGMKVTMFSLREAQLYGNGWSRVGANVRYEKSTLRKAQDRKFRYYALSFDLELGCDGDTVYLAMNVPYSYSRLVHHLRICEETVRRKQKEQEQKQQQLQGRKKRIPTDTHTKATRATMQWEMSIIGYSITNNAIPCITISAPAVHQPPSPTATSGRQSSPYPPKSKAIVMLARQHPGETWSSFMMEQLLYLVVEQKSPHVQSLLSSGHTLVLFPMVNIDGVVCGNFRCDVAGFDLNRNWRNPDPALHPVVSSIKSHIEQLASQYQVSCVLDLHGHSKQYNTFTYACKNDPVTARVLSLMISDYSEMFHFPFCTFGISKYKETTARAVIHKMVGVENILTVESSFYGAKVAGGFVEYDPGAMGELGSAILQGLDRYLNSPQDRAMYEYKIRQSLQQFLDYQQVPASGAADTGSQSQPFADEISIKEKIKCILPKVFKSIEKQLQQEEKLIKRKPVAAIKPKKSEKNSKLLPNGKIIKPAAAKNTKDKPMDKQESDESTAQTFVQRASFTNYKKSSKQATKKQRAQLYNNSQQSDRRREESEAKESERRVRRSLISKVGDVGLPFYVREKPSLIPIKLKNDSLQIFKDAYNSTNSKKFNYNESNLHRTMAKSSHKKVKIMNYSEYSSATEQFPLLCVLSQQKKKQTHYNKTHATLEQRSKDFSSLPPKFKSTLEPNQKLQALKKNARSKPNSFMGAVLNPTPSPAPRNKLKENAALISTIWRENFARYGKDLNVFFGGTKT